jgi:sulfur relay (sulfurtransferase) complex TusBCD TusD component (DsrE family)
MRKINMDQNTVLLFTHYGLGDAPEDLRLTLVVKFLTLLQEADTLPAKILFYTDGVKLACQGSPVLSLLKTFEAEGVELILCKTCLEYFNLAEKVEAGIVGGMPDIIEAMSRAPKLISL